MDIYDVASLVIWWTEGTKARPDKRWKNTFNYSVEVTNTDPEIIQLFLGYLRNRMNVQNERIKLQLQIHEGDDKEELESFWEQISGVPRVQFDKTIVRPTGTKIGKSKGTCKIRVYDKILHLRLLDSLDKLRGVVHRQNVRFGSGK